MQSYEAVNGRHRHNYACPWIEEAVICMLPPSESSIITQLFPFITQTPQRRRHHHTTAIGLTPTITAASAVK